MQGDFIIPQEINIQDRIGGFTIPQIAFVSVGLLIGMLLVISDLPIYVSLVIGIPVIALALALAFYQKYHMPLYQYMLVYLMYRSLPKYLIYRIDNVKDEYWDEEDEDIELFLE